MTTLTENNVKILADKNNINRITTEDAKAFTPPLVFRSPKMVWLDTPEPVKDADGSISNERLLKLSQTHKPHETWSDGEEEQLFE